MKQDRRMGIYLQFCEERSVLFSTDVASRGLDFNKAVDWVVQVDCPEDVASYIHRVGRTARYLSGGRSILFLAPSETKMLDKLQEKKIPVRLIKANTKRLESVSGSLAALLVKFPNLQSLAQRAFITYLKSIYKQRDKEVFDVTKLPIDEYGASIGLPLTPKVRFLKQNAKGKKLSEDLALVPESHADVNPSELLRGTTRTRSPEKAELELDESLLVEKNTQLLGAESEIDIKDDGPATRVLKKKKLKINQHRPVGSRVVFDDEGNTLAPLAKLADSNADSDSAKLDKDKVNQRYAELREKMKVADKEDKALDQKRRKEKRIKQKMKLKRGREEEEEDAVSEDDLSGSDREATKSRPNKKGKTYFDRDSDNGDDDSGMRTAPITLAEQEELALKLLSSMQ